MSPAQASTASQSFQTASDEELVKFVQVGNIDAFGELYWRYCERLCTYMARLVSSDDLGRDFAQEAFMKAFQSLPSLRGEVYFKSWLYQIAINVAKDHWRREKRVRFLSWKEYREFSSAEDMCIEGPEGRVVDADLVRMALAQVSLKCRPSLLLDIVEEMKQREIATFLGMSERNVRRYIYQGKGQLKEAYERLLSEVDTTTERRSTE